MLLSVLGCVAISSLNLHAQAIIAPSGRTMFHRGTLIRSFLKIEHASLQEEGQSSEFTRYVTPLALVYGFYPQWTVIAIQPYMSLDINSRMGETPLPPQPGLPPSIQ